MAAEPMAHVRAVAHTLLGAGATLVAGHSAHVFHGIAPHVLYDLGDFLDDYRVDRVLRNDLGLLFLVDLAISRLEAIPLKLEFGHTRFADGEDAAWIRRRFADTYAPFGTTVTEEDGRLVCSWRWLLPFCFRASIRATPATGRRGSCDRRPSELGSVTAVRLPCCVPRTVRRSAVGRCFRRLIGRTRRTWARDSRRLRPPEWRGNSARSGTWL